MKYISLVFLLFIQNILFGQELTVKGQVKDSLANPLPLTNIQILDINSKSLAYVTTNNKGLFEIHTNYSDNLSLKISCLGYETKTEKISPERIFYTITLKEKATTLDEVKITADFRDVTEKNDTISYNLKRLLNGSETTLKDVVKKLPGLNIDDNGKINYNGKKIDNILIEGDELYDNQHQLATENIKSEMIEKIDFLKNHQDLSSIKGFGDNNKTALNISLKEQYKNTIKGDVSAEYGYKERYKQHNTIYNFGTQNKINLIADLNNVNKPILTITDYLELKKGISTSLSSETVGATFKVEENLPSFLFSEDNVNSKKINFYSLNFNRTFSKKTKLKGYTFFNFIKQTEFLNSFQNFYTLGNPESLIKKSVSEGTSGFNINKIELEHKQNENSYYNYLLITNYSNDKQENNLRNISFQGENQFNERNNISNFNLGQKLSYRRKLNPKTLFDLSLYNDLTFGNNTLQLQSNAPFLNLNFQQGFISNQQTDYHNSRLGFNSKINFNGTYGTYTVKAGSSSEQERLTSFLNSSNPEFNFDTTLYKSNNYFGLNFKNKRNVFFNYLLGLDLLYNQVNHNTESETITTLLPSANLNFDCSKKLNFSIGYKKSVSTPQIKQTNNGLLLENYRTILDNSQIDFSTPLEGNSFTFNSSYNDFESGINSFISAIYNKNKKAIGSNSQNTTNSSIKESRFINLDNSLYMLLMFEKKFKSIPWAIKLSSLQSRFEKDNYSNNIQGVFKTRQNKTEMEFISYFKSNSFNLNFGCEYIDSHSSNKPQNEYNSFYRLTPYVNIYGVVYKNMLSWSLNSKYLHYQSSRLPRQNILDLSPEMALKTTNWIFTIGGNNVLNIKNNNQKTTIDYNSTYTEETVFSSLSGYLNFGASFSF